MTKYCRIENGLVKEFLTWEGDIYDVMHKDLEWVESGKNAVLNGTYTNGKFGSVPATPDAELLEDAQNMQYLLNIKISSVIAPLQDAVDLGRAADEDKTKLTIYKQYRIDLSKVPTQTTYPKTIQWPEFPQ